MVDDAINRLKRSSEMGMRSGIAPRGQYVNERDAEFSDDGSMIGSRIQKVKRPGSRIGPLKSTLVIDNKDDDIEDQIEI